MNKQDCLFCKIIRGELPAKKIQENDQVLVVEDIAPKAPIHYLVIPKVHLENMRALADEHRDAVWHVLTMGRDLSLSVPGAENFNFISNNGAKAGQSVFHMHWHFIAGRSIYKNSL